MTDTRAQVQVHGTLDPQSGHARSRDWGGRRGLLLAGVCFLASVSGCATSASTSNTDSRGELITESDEPEDRKRARIRTELAAGYFEQGQTTVALDQIKQALQADPNYAPAFSLRGLVYMRLNDFPLAEDSFRRALQINPKDPDSLQNYGYFLYQQGRYKEAVDVLRRALSSPLYTGQAKTLMTLGLCQLRMGQLSEAEGSFSRAYELDPANPYAGFHLAQLEFRRGELQRSQFVIRRLNNSEQANSESLWLGIKIERKLNNKLAVEQLAEQLKRRFPRSKEWAAYQRGAFDE
ncbi:MAG: type IV pilus biogenesis/stability protein PilW [Hydrogenophaga sp.]|nr:type IV pilus biogenesis/stability protein PilW [Hydrogenophaga sp.]